MAGPLSGIKIIELAGIGPSPYACMLLADAGADILRFERTSGAMVPEGMPNWDLLNRSRRSVGIDLKNPDAVSLLLELVAEADVVIEGFRPGVAERLGVGPEACLAANPAIVYGRMTGWGQDGVLADRAGHDINYIAISGALWPMGRSGDIPVPPLNLVGDFGGGGMMLAFGVTSALLSARTTGVGQVVDAAMTDGSASLMTMVHAFKTAGLWEEERGANMLDTGAHFYEVYETKDAKFMSVGAIERKFYAELMAGLGLDPTDFPDQMDRSGWADMKRVFAERFATKTRDEWTAIFEGVDACTLPVLSPFEAPDHPHNVARGTFVEVAGVVQPGPAPRFSATPSEISKPPSNAGADTDEALASWGVPADRIAELRAVGAVG
ncbi:MAG: CaiB/BaiF CoA-transferase family protein [Actinomycetes bacterium]